MQDTLLQTPSTVAYRHALVIGILTGLCGVLYLFNNLLGTNISNTLWADDYDARLIYWILEWGYHVLWQVGDPASFWNANSFYPHLGSLAFSDSLIAGQIIYSPSRLLGFPPLIAMYITLAGTCIIGTTLTSLALTRVGITRRSILIIILAIAHFSPPIFNFALHYQLFGIHFAIPFLVAIWGYYRSEEWFDFNLSLVSGTLSVCFAAYFAPMLCAILFLMIILGIIRLTLLGRLIATIRGVSASNTLNFIPKLALALLIGTVVYLIQLAPYQRLFNSEAAVRPESERLFEQRHLSARPSSLLRERSTSLYWYTRWSRSRATERAYFPGYLILALGVAGIVVGVFNKQSSQLAKSAVLYGCSLLTAAIVLSLGPRLAGHPDVAMPFEYLSSFIPGVSNIRAPGRFGIFAGLALALISFPFLELLYQSAKTRSFLIILPVILALECWPSLKAYPFWRGDQNFYRQLASYVEPNTPLIELPIAGRDSISDVRYAVQQLQGSTIHWGRLVAGYGARETTELRELRKIDRKLQRGEVGISSLIKFATKLKIRFLVIHYSRYRPQTRSTWNSWYSKLGTKEHALSTQVFRDKKVMVVRLELSQ